jgi:DNA-binding transcriptional ArsR family regulator
MSDVYKALSDPTRRKILQLLRKEDLTAGEIGNHFDISAPALSRHFTILRAANLITSEKKGNFVAYQVNVSVLEEALLGLMNLFNLEFNHEQDDQH